jgi:hypothetical protein
MTVNERLWEAELMSDFQAAVRAKDREAIISVLTKVALSREDAGETADAVLANPKYYGY